MSRKMLRNVEKRGVHAARNGAGSNFGSVADIRTEIHGLWLIRSRFTCDPPPTDLPILGLFSIEIPGFSVLKCYLPMPKAKPVWLCFGAFPSLPTPFLRIHRPPGTILSSLPVHPGRSPPGRPITRRKLASFWRFSQHFLVSGAFPSVHSPLATTPASRWAPSLHWPLAATRRLCHRQFTGLRGAGHRRGDAKHHPRSPDILSLRQGCPSLASVSGSWLSSMAQARSLWARSG